MMTPTADSLGQQPEKKKKPRRTDTFIRLDGIRLGIDVSRPFQSLWNKGDRFGIEASADMEIKPNLFPVVEAGWEKLTLDHSYVDYTASGSYMRVGIDYNILGISDESQEPDRHTLFAGLRYGFGLGSQQVNRFTTDSYWGPVTGSFPSQNFSAHWGELVFGIKAEVFRNFFMGWTLRGKFHLSGKDYDMPPVYFNPGFGRKGGAAFDFTYSIFYALPVKLHKNVGVRPVATP